MKLSIIIVSYNTKDLLQECLQSIFARTKTELEVIVVDNNSSDGSVAFLKGKYSEVRIIENDQNTGFSKANNLGARNSRGEFVLFLNSDTQVKDDALDKMVAFMEAHPEIGILGPRLVYPDGRFQLSAGQLPNLSREFRDRRIYRRLDKGDEKLRKKLASRFNQPAEVGWITGACLLIRRSLLFDLDGFDENMFMFFEDKDLCQRAREAGWKVVYFPFAEVMHIGGASSGKEKSQAERSYRESQIYYYRKHHGLLSNLGLLIYLKLKYQHEKNPGFRNH